jgi:glycosidase
LDYVPGPSHAFWTGFQQAVKTRYPQALTLGEITGSSADIATYAGRIDGAMNFPLAKMMRDVFAQRIQPLSAMFDLIAEQRRSFPQSLSQGTLLDNHDTHRFLWLADERLERLIVAAVCHLTLEGSPIVYYGTEVGLSQYDDAHKENAHARAPMLWGEDQNQELLNCYCSLITLRHQHTALRAGRLVVLPIHITVGSERSRFPADQQIGAYLRQDGHESIVVVINNSESECTVQIELAAVLGPQMRDQVNWQQVYPNAAEVVAEQSVLTVQVAALNAGILIAR